MSSGRSVKWGPHVDFKIELAAETRSGDVSGRGRNGRKCCSAFESTKFRHPMSLLISSVTKEREAPEERSFPPIRMKTSVILSLREEREEL